MTQAENGIGNGPGMQSAIIHADGVWVDLSSSAPKARIVSGGVGLDPREFADTFRPAIWPALYEVQ
jgi:hypothetical protein